MSNPISHRSSKHPTIALGLLGGALLAQPGGGRQTRRLLAFLGLSMIGYAARPLMRNWLVRRGAARRRIRLSTSLEIARPVSEVFAFCKDFENFPRVFGSLKSVTDYQDGRSHWEGYSSSGDPVAWDAIVTKYVPNVVIGWSSVPGSDVESSGIIRFAATEKGTRLRVEIVYTPGETDLGEAIRALATQSREHQIRDELARAAFYIESLPPAPENEEVSAPS